MSCDKYIVRPMDEVVVGIKELGFDDGVISEIYKTMKGSYARPMAAFITENYLDVGDEFKRLAKCKDGDTFSVDVGKNIVDCKTSYKYHKAMKRRYARAIKHLENVIEDFKKLEAKHSKSEDSYKQKIDWFMPGDISR